MEKIDVLALPPDLYSRNLIISEGIQKYKKLKNLDSLKILDIGGRRGNLDLFLDSSDELTLLDIRKGNEENLIVGDATNMAMFDNDSFDIVTSGDVFEHVPLEKRESFVSESIRVSRGLVILAAPFNDKSTKKAELAANEFYKKLTKQDHEWLKEHIDNGLPKKDDLEKMLYKFGHTFSTVCSNSLDNWLIMQQLMSIFFAFGINDGRIKDIFRYYNENILQIENFENGSYREVFFISKDEFRLEFAYSFDGGIKLGLIQNVFDAVADIIFQKNEEFDAMKKHADIQALAIQKQEKKINITNIYRYIVKKIR